MKVEIFACPLWWWCGWLRSCDDLVFRSPALNPGAWLGIAGGGLEQTAGATWDTHHQSPHTCHARDTVHRDGSLSSLALLHAIKKLNRNAIHSIENRKRKLKIFGLYC